MIFRSRATGSSDMDTERYSLSPGCESTRVAGSRWLARRALSDGTGRCSRDNGGSGWLVRRPKQPRPCSLVGRVPMDCPHQPAPHQQASPAATPPAPLIPMPGGQRAPRSRVSVLGATWLTLAGLWVALFVVAAALDRNHKIPGWIAEPVRLGLYALVGVGILWIVRWRQAKRQPPGSH